MQQLSHQSFNSTLVRLRPGGIPYKANSKASFNSTLVRLRPPLSCCPPGWRNPGFNSTLVRLRLRIHFAIIGVISLFQFHIGSIKTGSFSNSDTAFFGFNSTLVRLRLSRRLPPSSHQSLFQFHIGSIKTLLPPRLK